MSTALALGQSDLSPTVTAEPPRKPFLKWAGGKYRVLPHILAVLPKGKRLIEPFAGSAAVSLNAGFENSLVADANADLINLYVSIKSDVDRFLAESAILFNARGNTREAFVKIRSEFNHSTDKFRKSVLFVYLNRHCFNGLCRYNSKGHYNVPFGKYSKPYFPRKEIEAFAQSARRMEFLHQEFDATMAMAGDGDIVYCDPPYVPLSETANFTSYAPGEFGPAEQARLAETARACTDRGATVVISNHDTAFSREIYRGARILSFPVRRFISSKAATRGSAPEMLAIFDPK